MSQVSCSVIIPAYNAEDVVAIAVRSVLAQTRSDLELIVLDDGSTDHTYDRALEAGSGDARLTLERTTSNRGVAETRNRGIALANGTWIAMLDADDAFDRERLEVLIAKAESLQADMVADNLLVRHYGSDATDGLAFPVTRMKDGAFISAATFATFDRPRWGLQAIGFMKPLIRRSFIQEHGVRYHSKLSFGEDFHFYMQCLLNGARLSFLPIALYHYTVFPHSLSRGDNEDARRDLILFSSRYLIEEATLLGNKEAVSALRSRELDFLNWTSYRALTLAISQHRFRNIARILSAMPSKSHIPVCVAADLRYDVARRLGKRLNAASLYRREPHL
jgi:glycosyltransferase involved in cell wall biosynthesis